MDCTYSFPLPRGFPFLFFLSFLLLYFSEGWGECKAATLQQSHVVTHPLYSSLRYLSISLSFVPVLPPSIYSGPLLAREHVLVSSVFLAVYQRRGFPLFFEVHRNIPLVADTFPPPIFFLSPTPHTDRSTHFFASQTLVIQFHAHIHAKPSAFSPD
jgi:hypothetical protein